MAARVEVLDRPAAQGRSEPVRRHQIAAALAGHAPTTFTAARHDDVCALAAPASTGAGAMPLVANLTLVETGRTGDAGADA